MNRIQIDAASRHSSQFCIHNEWKNTHTAPSHETNDEHV